MFKEKEEEEEVTLDKVMDDNNQINDSFNKIKEEIEAKTKENDKIKNEIKGKTKDNDLEKKLEKKLTERVVVDFVLSCRERAIEKRVEEKKSVKIACPLGVDIPKNKRVIREESVKVPAAIGIDSKGIENKGSKRCIEDKTNGKEKPRRSKKKEKNMNEDPPMPEELKNRIKRMNGTNVLFVIEKELLKSDLDGQQSRLSIPISQIIHPEFLEEEEKRELQNGIEVSLIEPSLTISNLKLKKWPTSTSYVLMSGWKEVVNNDKNNFKKDAIVRLWSFRQGLKLWFALINIRDGKDDSGASGGNGNEGVLDAAGPRQNVDMATRSDCGTLNH